MTASPRLGARAWLVAALLFAIAFWLRIGTLDVSLYGDETWYFHLARTLGLGNDHVVNPFPRAAHVLARPFLYVFYWPWAQLGFTTFRAVNIVISAATVSVTALVCQSLRLGRLASFVACLLVATHQMSLCYATRVFPDTPATFFALLAVWAFVAERPRATFLLCVAATLTKEAFALIPLALLALSIELGGPWQLRLRRPMAYWVAASLLPLALLTLVSIFLLGGRLQGWSNLPPDGRFLGIMGFGWDFAALYLALAVLGYWRVLVLALANPLFYLAWWHILGRGVNEWYVVGAIPMTAMAVAAALDGFGRAARLARTSLVGRVRAIVAGALLGTFAAQPLLAVPDTPWAHLLVSLQLEWYRHPKETDWSALPPIVARLHEAPPSELLLVDCFWAHSFYPFGLVAEHVEIVRAVPAGTTEPQHRDHDIIPELTPDRLEARAARADAVVILEYPANRPLRDRLARCRVASSGVYHLYREPARCL